MRCIDDAMTQIANHVDEYVRFMRIERFPAYDLKFKEVSLFKADLQGFDSLASTAYDVNTHNHTLCIATNLPLEKYVLFHEFTHMLDSEEHTNGDKNRYAGLLGYTEYHASQVELMQLLGAKSIGEIPSFSINSFVHTLSGEKSISQYVHEKQMHAIELFSRSDFPANIDTLKSAVANEADVVIIDTAGRLHNKVGLMNELAKIRNVMAKIIPDAPHEVMLVLDGSTGQNAFEQARQFTAATKVNSLAITKLDGTAKGGVVIGISDQFAIPVHYIGIGEGIDQLKIFDRHEYVNALFGNK